MAQCCMEKRFELQKVIGSVCINGCNISRDQLPTELFEYFVSHITIVATSKFANWARKISCALGSAAKIIYYRSSRWFKLVIKAVMWKYIRYFISESINKYIFMV